MNYLMILMNYRMISQKLHSHQIPLVPPNQNLPPPILPPSRTSPPLNFLPGHTHPLTSPNLTRARMLTDKKLYPTQEKVQQKNGPEQLQWIQSSQKSQPSKLLLNHFRN